MMYRSIRESIIQENKGHNPILWDFFMGLSKTCIIALVRIALLRYFNHIIQHTVSWGITNICLYIHVTTFELRHYKTNKTACVPHKDADKPGHLPSLIRVFALHLKVS